VPEKDESLKVRSIGVRDWSEYTMTDLQIAPEHGTLAHRRRFGRLSFGHGRRTSSPLITEGRESSVVAVRDHRYRRALGLVDGLAAAMALEVVIRLQAGGDVRFWSLLAMPLIVLVHKVAGLYERDEVVLNRTTLDEVPTLVQLSGLFALIVWLGHWRMFSVTLTPEFVLEFWALLAVLTIAGRKGARAGVRRWSGAERCLLIGDDGAIETMRGKLYSSRVSADVVATMRATTLGLRESAELRQLITRHDVQRVIFAPSVSSHAEETLDMIRLAKSLGVRVSVVPRLLEVVGSSVEFDHLDGLTMLGVRRFGLTRSSRTLKRGFDLVGATVGLLSVAPIAIAIAIAVRLDSRGPIFFRQTRVGRDGEHFQMLKFRSMVPDAEERKSDLRHLNETEGLFKIAGDPRITRVGRLLRKTSLDELPQLINVWRGEMSLVGPRPLVVDEDAQISGLDRSRLHLTPGMTGHWQILGSTRVPLEEMVGIDYLYVANWSLWNDLKLLMRTIPFVLARRGL
jgi:exopolysaccharide biosynthesis polyprenyl glycosylphosphotransferase